MNPEAAQITFGILMTIVVIAWAISLRLASRMGNANDAKAEDPFAPISFEPSEQKKPDGIASTLTVRGSLQTVSAAIVDQFTRTAVPGNMTTLFEVTDATEENVSVKKTGPLMCNQPTGMYFSEASFHLSQLGQDVVEVSYELGFERFHRRLKKLCFALIVGVGLPVMVIVGFLIWTLVVSSANPNVRWQVFQTLQIFHVIWPPYLFVWMYGSSKVHSNTYVSNMLRALRPAEFKN